MFRYIENRLARTIVRGVAKLSKLRGLTVRQDREGYDRYFLSADTNYRTQTKFTPQQIISYRKKKYRWGRKKALTRLQKYELSDNTHASITDFKDDTFNEWHLGYLSYYREANTGRYMWDTPQRDNG